MGLRRPPAALLNFGSMHCEPADESPADDKECEPALPIATPEDLEREIEAVLLAREASGKEPLPAGAVTRLATHAHLMLMANATRNLTRITEPREVAVKHVLDSLLAVDAVDLRGARVLDLGTGAGYPGIPIAIAVPSASVVMIDGTEKKVAFVDDALEALALPNAAALHTRAEVHLKDYAYDYLVARAVGPLDRLLPLLLPRRSQFSALVALKGPSGPEEWNRAVANQTARGFDLAAAVEEELPHGAGKRTILVIVPTGARRLRPRADAGKRAEGS